MVRQSLVSFLVFLIAVVGASPADTRDWFVKAGATGGDGSRERPFADPWQALERVEAHDKVHVAAGRYFGQLEAGTWVIPFPGVELLGGYDASFTERNPWQHVSELAWNAESANKPNVSLARVSMETNRGTTGAAIDGFLIDMRETYQYASGNLITPYRNGAVSLAKGTAVRNCIIVNSANGAVKTSAGALVENNLIINTALVAIQATGGGNDAPPVVVRHNTIAFTWDPEAPGKGGPRGIAIAASNAVLVEHNLIVHADNFAVAINQPARSTFTGNVFYRNLFANLRFYLDSRESALDDTDLDAAEEIGFAHAGENLAADPALTFDAQWYDAFLRRTAGTGQRFDAAAWEETRTNAGLPAPTSPEKLALFAPAYPKQAFAGLMMPKNAAVQAGARIKALPVSFGTGGPATPAKHYARTSLEAIAKNAAGFDGRAVEVIAGIVGVTGVSGLPDLQTRTHKGCFLADVQGKERMPGYFQKGTAVERTIDATPLYGSGPPQDLFVVRGTVRVTTGYPKYALVIDTLERYEAAVVAAERPQGRDWFVRAGARGGDGSREKPFTDPYQALEQAARGDRIHVTAGEYGGKLKSGKWVIDKPWLALLGGYDRDFTTRDPWRQPSLLQWPADSKTKAQGSLLEGAGDHTGLIIDGFIFDRKTRNAYQADGSLDPARSDDSPHLRVFAQDAVVRNCVFVNGAGGAVRMSTGITFENNLILNVWHSAITVTASGGPQGTPAVIRNNTILFVWERRFHDASNASGIGIDLQSNAKAIVEGNILQYVDNFAVKANVRLSELVLNRNVFFLNWAALRSTAAMPPPTVAEHALGQLAELPLKQAEGNVTANGDFDLDPTFYARWFVRTSKATTRFTEAAWQAIAPKEGGDTKAGIAPAYDFKLAATLVPRNGAVTAGARPAQLDVAFGR